MKMRTRFEYLQNIERFCELTEIHQKCIQTKQSEDCKLIELKDLLHSKLLRI